MKKIEEPQGLRCENPGCHRLATYETKSGKELCGVCARQHPEWEEKEDA